MTNKSIAIAFLAAGVLAVTAPADAEHRESAYVVKKLRRDAREVAEKARHLRRAAERSARHWRRGDARSLVRLHELEDRAWQLDYQLRHYPRRYELQRAFEAVDRAFLRAADAAWSFRRYGHLGRDFDRLADTMVDLGYSYEAYLYPREARLRDRRGHRYRYRDRGTDYRHGGHGRIRVGTPRIYVDLNWPWRHKRRPERAYPRGHRADQCRDPRHRH